MNCKRCGGPKPPGQGRKFCSPECREAGPATGVRRCPECDEDRLVPVQMREKAVYCERCHARRRREYAKRHYEANRAAILARLNEYREEHREELNAKRRAYYQAHRDEIRIKQAAYYQETREYQLAKSRRWYEANRERTRIVAARWRERNAEHVSAQKRRWAQRMLADPVKRAQRNEVLRMNARLRAEREGRPLKPVPVGTYVKRYGRGHQGHGHQRVSVEPLLPLLREIENVKVWTSDVDIDSTIIYDILRGEVQSLTIRDADVLCVALGLPMTLVYGEVAA
jgi:hypothetical protein